MSSMRFFFLILSFFSFGIRSEPAYFSFPSDIEWRTQASPHFEIIFRKGQTDFAKKTLHAAEKAYQLLFPIFLDAPPTTRIVLADFTDSLNGYSLNFPYPHFVIFATPPSSNGEMTSLDDWLDSVVLHEYVHTLHLYPASGFWRVMRSIFGTWVVPNGMMPQHLHEGLATFLETQLSEGGRGRSPFFKMLTRKAVEKKVFGKEFVPLDLLDGSYSYWPHGVSPYYFGYFVYEALWKKKGAAGIQALTQSYSSNWPYWLNRPLQDIFATDYPSLWKKIEQEQSLLFQNELEQIRKNPLSTLRYLTESRFFKKELLVSSSQDTAIFLSSNPDKGRTVEFLDLKTGKILNSRGLPFSGAGGLCWRADTPSMLIASTVFGEDFYKTNRLSRISLDGKTQDHLGHAGEPLENIHEFDCYSESKTLSVFQYRGGRGTLSRYGGDPFSNPGNLILERRWEIPQDTWITSIKASSSTYFLLRNKKDTQLFEWGTSPEPKKLLEIPGHAYQLKIGRDNSFYFIASFSGRNEVWNWKKGQRAFEKVIAVSGGTNSFDLLPKSILVSSYEQGGFDIAEASTVKPEKVALAQNSTGSKKSPPVSVSLSEEKEYSPFYTLAPRTWVPSALFVPYGLQVGAWIPMFDLSQKHFYDVNLGIDERETQSGTKILPFLSTQYGYRFGRSHLLSLNAYYAPTFLTITRSFFERWGTSIGISRRLPGLPIQARVSGILRKIERSDLGPANRSVGLGVDLGWSTAQTAAVFDRPLNEEMRLVASHQQYFKGLGSQDNYFSTVFSLDAMVSSPLWSEAAWYFGLRQGYTEGTAFYNSFFEGGGEILFNQNRGFFLNRGYLQGSFAARRIFGGNLEFRFPIAVVERGVSLWPAFFGGLTGALVLDTTSFDSGIYGRVNNRWMKQFLWSTGFELKTYWKFFYYLPTELRFGAYRGLSQGGEPFYFTIGLQASL